MATLNVDLPKIELKLRVPRLYGLRLRIVGWLILAASWVAGDIMVIQIVGPDEPEVELDQPKPEDWGIHSESGNLGIRPKNYG